MGNDENDGYTSITALKTTDELQRRWGTDPIIQTSIIINFLTATSNNVINLNIGRDNIDYNVSLLGPANTVLVTSTLATYTVPSTVNNEVTVISITGITDFTPYVNKKVNFGANGVARICAVNPSGMGNQYARITLPMGFGATNYSAIVYTTPVVGQTVTIEELGLDLSTININTFGAYGIHDPESPHYRPFVIIRSLQIQKQLNLFSTDTFSKSNNYPFIVFDCDVRDLKIPNWNAQMVSGSLSSRNSFYINYFCVGILIKQGAGTTNTDIMTESISGYTTFYGVVLQGVSLLIYTPNVILTNIAIFDATYGMQIHNGGSVYLNGYLLGKGNTTYGYKSGTNGLLMKTGSGITKITGTSGDWAISTTGDVFSWATTPIRKFDRNSGQIALVNGTITVSEPNLPTDAIINVTYKTIIGQVGILTVPTQTTSGFTITSTSNTDDSIIYWSWLSPGSGMGGIVNS